MASTTIFVPNPLGIAAIPRTPEMERAMMVYGEKVAVTAQAIAPKLTGAYAASIKAVPDIEDGKAASTVVATVPYAVFVEFGTSDTPTFAPLRRAMEAVT